MSYYDDASLVLIPSGVKAAKVYSQKPTNGSGDFTFARASTATRTNSAGLVESGRTNFIRNSSMVGAATPNTIPTNWTASTTAGMTREVVGVGTESGFPYVDIRYFGTPTSTGFIGIQFETNTQIAALSGQAWAYSFYFKKIAGTVPSAGFQLTEYNSSGTYLTNSSVAVALNTTTTLTRFSGTRILTQATTAFTNTFLRLDVTAAVAYDFTMRFYAPQIELGSVATDWIPTTTSAASVGIGINVPRLDYMTASGSLATCPMLEVEAQRTNLALQSETFDNASWIKAGVTVTANTAISPDGTQDADTIDLGAGGFANIRQGIAVANNTSYTVSCYYKNIALTAGQTFEMRYTNELVAPNNLNAIATIDLFAGTVSSAIAGTIGTGYSGTVSSTITNVGNDWYRVTMTFTVGSAGAATGNFRPAVIAIAQARTFYAWGAQLEVGSFVSTYIPTTAATVTRIKDDVSISGASALIGQTEGTIFLDVDFRSVSLGGIRVFFALEGSVSNQFSGLTAGTSSNNNDIQYAGVTHNLTQGRHKIVCTYNSTTNQRKLFVDGAQRGSTGTSAAFLATLDRISILGRVNPFNAFAVDRQQFGGCNQFALWKTALSDAQCIQLSTL